MRLIPPFIALFLLLIAIFLHFTFPNSKLISFPYNLIGIVFLFLGLFTIALAIKLFEKKGTTHKFDQKPKSLVTTGLYSYTRNPMYSGITSILFGIALLVGTIPFFVATPIFPIIMNFFFIPYEEKLLEKIFGKQYLEYKKRVRRWI